MFMELIGLAGRPVGSVSWLVGWLVGWLFGWLVTLQGLGAVGAETLGNVYGAHWLGRSAGRVG